MALLTSEQRQALWAAFQRDDTGEIGVTKPELRAAVDAIDHWVEDNAASFNTAIPQPARGALTAKQKSLLLVHVVTQRFKVS